ncbi:alkaline phosphatase PhoX [Flavobacterium sp. RHBU_24]|uniref:alkaline phosphatase PhoX n=1 Tax=Flavobacterium sp. RHBU_24 TaxID=3391185 RepID=UPI0039847BA4
MKKRLLPVALLFSLGSFAVVVSGEFPEFTDGKTAAESTKTVAETKPATQNKTAVKTAKAAFTLEPASYPLGKDSEWHYLDSGTSLDGTAWNLVATDNSAWASGPAPLGYGDAVNTTISYGADSENKYVTTYFFRDININLADVAEMVEFGVKRDDGVVVYVNGVEAFRDNMPEGNFNYLSFSAETIDGADEQRYFVHEVPKTIFTQGVNRIAVEVHNRSASSSDIKFDMYVQDAPTVVSCEEPHIGCFTSINPTGQTPNMIIPAEHRFQMMLKEGETYTLGTGGNEPGTVPGNHDYTAYVPVNGSSTLGRVAVNHENNPGGVSIVNTHFNENTSLWVQDNSQAVDMYTPSLVTTIRNCSGGTTPWNTVITAEENTSGGDSNGDGYQDVGWLVEIDPATAAVKDYDNDGNKDKLWKLGRMNHENVVVNAAGTAAYEGEDGGTNCVYKFVPTTPGDLTAGNLYVLKLDLGLQSDEPASSTATWIQVPNTTPADCNNVTSVALSLGGTNFNGVEDCEISPLDGMIYFTSKGKNRIYRFKDNGMTISNFETFVGGMSYPIETASGTVVEPWGDGNDNITFDDKGNLWLLQDGGKNYIWVVRPDHRQSMPHVLLHSSMPAGSEPTGLTFTPDFKYGFFSVQHPDSGNTPQTDATGNQVTFNASAVVVFSLGSNLGLQAPSADFVANDVTVTTGTQVTFTDLSTHTPTSWAWTFEGGNPATSTAQSPVVTYATAGTYNVSLVTTNAAGTSETETKTDYITVETAAGTNDPALTANVKVYPNPTNGIVKVDLTGNFAGQDATVEVFDIVGRKVTEVSATGSASLQVDLSAYPSDQVFILTVHAGNATASYKIVKVK